MFSVAQNFLGMVERDVREKYESLDDGGVVGSNTCKSASAWMLSKALVAPKSREHFALPRCSL